MARDRFFKLRNSLKIADGLDVTEETKEVDSLWRLWPLLHCMEESCPSFPKPEKVCIDQQIIPFTDCCPSQAKPCWSYGFCPCLSKLSDAGFQSMARIRPILHNNQYHGCNQAVKNAQQYVDIINCTIAEELLGSPELDDSSVDSEDENEPQTKVKISQPEPSVQRWRLSSTQKDAEIRQDLH